MLDSMISLTQGDCIIAPPRMQDSRFVKSVIMLTHSNKGAWFGLCLNKPSNHSVADLNAEIDCEMPHDIGLNWGGPVNSQTIWMLHSAEWQIDATVKINEHWSMTSHVSMFHHLANHDRPLHYLMTFGFCGWSQNQLAAELQGQPPWTVESSWLTWKQPDTHLLEIESSQLWRISTEQSAHQAVAHWMA